ncbi:hypothetical protein B0H11DRAFT_2287922 [Mycena galericulata]|nr:hypothetical protein B0H11DRAFT_2287922 [Mycena galericulata]
MAAAQAAAQGRNFPAMIRSFLRPVIDVPAHAPPAPRDRPLLVGYPSRATSLRARTRSQRRWPLSVAAVPTLLRRAAPATPHPSRAACRPRPNHLLVVPVRHRHRYTARLHLAHRLRTTTPLGSHATTSLPFARRPSHPTPLAIPTAPNVARRA